MKRIVGVADMIVSDDPHHIIVTHALGSCLGVAVYDPQATVAGMLHVMMPMSKINPEKAKQKPFMFVDTGVPEFFNSVYAVGGRKERLVVKVAGGARVNNNQNDDDRFAIGKRNFVVLKKLFWKNNVLIDAHDVGGTCSRTMYLEVATGRTYISSAGEKTEL